MTSPLSLIPDKVIYPGVARPLISVLLPTTGRPARVVDCVRQLLATTDQHRLEVICPVDADLESHAALTQLLAAEARQRSDFRYCVPYSESYQGCSQAWNQALALSRGDYLVFAADDLLWEPGWLDEALRVMNTLPPGGGLVGFNDGHWHGQNLSTHYLLSRQFIIDHLGGVIAWPVYQHSFNDLEVNERAKRAGRFAWAENAHVVHEHWTFGSRPQDDSDRRFLAGWETSRLAFQQRQTASFPCDYPPVITSAAPAPSGSGSLPWPTPQPPLRIGWLVDDPGYLGGAELTAQTLQQAAPLGIDIVPCPPDQPWAEVDAYVIHNCVRYSAAILPHLMKKPVIKVVHDVWPHGDARLRAWLLDHAAQVIFFSQRQRDLFAAGTAPTSILPVALDLTPFRQARQAATERSGTLWLGHLFPGKGVEQAVQWANRQHTLVDFYGQGPLASAVTGWGRYRGPVDYGQVPALLARYQRLLFLPTALEPFGRVAVEAWAAGCQLTLNRNVGALEWLRSHPANLDQGAAHFWQGVAQWLQT